MTDHLVENQMVKSPFEPTKRAQPDNLSVDKHNKKINNCIANQSKSFYFFVKENKDEYEKAKEIFKRFVKLIWLISKNVKSNFKALAAD